MTRIPQADLRVSGPVSVQRVQGPGSGSEYVSPQEAPHTKLSNPVAVVSQKVLIKSFRRSKFPHKSVNIFFILVIVKDKFTDLWGS